MKKNTLISKTLSNLAAVLTRSCNENNDAASAINELWKLSHVLENGLVGHDDVLAACFNRSEKLYFDSCRND